MDRDDFTVRFAVDALVNERRRSGPEPVEFRRYEAPCLDCPHRQRCADESLACRQFRVFVHSPTRVNYEAERIPTREMYDALFAQDDEEA